MAKVFWCSAHVLIFLFFITGCTTKNKTKDIIERYKNGDKKVVNTYVGKNENEELLRTTVFAKNGEKIKIINRASGRTRTYSDLHTHYSKADGLEKFLSKKVWYLFEDIPTLQTLTVIKFGPEKITRYGFTEEEPKLDTYVKSTKIKYSNRENYTFLEGDLKGEKQKIHLMGPNRFSFGSREIPFRRVDPKNLESTLSEAGATPKFARTVSDSILEQLDSY